MIKIVMKTNIVTKMVIIIYIILPDLLLSVSVSSGKRVCVGSSVAVVINCVGIAVSGCGVADAGIGVSVGVAVSDGKGSGVFCGTALTFIFL